MKRLLFLLCFTLATLFAISQNISKVTLGETGNMAFLSIDIDENIQINVSPEGSIAEWGIDLYKGRYQMNMTRLEPYTGRVDHYSEYDNVAYKGKIKYIGRTLVTYYASFDDEILVGKIKSIGKINLDYHPKYENTAYAGKLKSAGPLEITYYPAFGKDPNAGKLKSVGSASLTYYGPFEDKAFQGKVKSIGNINYQYFSSTERPEYRGRLKSGSTIQPVNGIWFHIKS